MIIRPVSDLRNHYKDIECEAKEKGPVFLTKNGYGSMVLMSIEQYELITGGIEAALDVADHQAESTPVRYTHEEVFGSVRNNLRDVG